MGGLTVVVLLAFPSGLAGALSGLFDRLMTSRGERRAERSRT